MLDQEAVNEFKKIYKAEYGEAISDDDARERGEHLIRFTRLILSGSKPQKNKQEKLPADC